MARFGLTGPARRGGRGSVRLRWHGWRGGLGSSGLGLISRRGFAVVALPGFTSRSLAGRSSQCVDTLGSPRGGHAVAAWLSWARSSIARQPRRRMARRGYRGAAVVSGQGAPVHVRARPGAAAGDGRGCSFLRTDGTAWPCSHCRVRLCVVLSAGQPPHGVACLGPVWPVTVRPFWHGTACPGPAWTGSPGQASLGWAGHRIARRGGLGSASLCVAFPGTAV